MSQEHRSPTMNASFTDPVAAMLSSNQSRRISLWMLYLEDEIPTVGFVYGCVLPSRRAGGSPWATFEVRRFSKKVRFVRHSADLDAATCHSVLNAIATGTSLFAALAGHNLAPEDLANSKLVTLSLERLPNAYFSGAPQLHGLPGHLAARPSPVNGVGCYCARFVPAERFAFLPTDPETSEDLLRELCVALHTETGLAFDGSAGDAFGSLEVYHFPSLDEFEKPRVEVCYAEPPQRTVTVTLREGDPYAEFAVQLRTEQVRDIASDELHLVDPSTQAVTIELPEPLDGVLIRVWKRRKDPSGWLLWHEQEDHFLREIGVRMDIAGLSGSVGARWLDQLQKTKRLSSRVERFKEIRQIAMDSPMEVSSRRPWETAVQNARKLTASTVDATTGDRFFQREWGSDERKFEFAEWLKTELSSHRGSILVVDPYFDLLGLDLICRASGAASDLTVLTCTQVPSEDDEQTVTRAERLRSTAEDLFEVLRGLRLRICDLRSAKASNGTKSLIHDRYILFLDASGNAEKGYNLSTSLQSAATTSPILITTIARGILDDVADYVFGLMTPSEERVLETIFPTEVPARRRSSLGLTEARARTVIAALEAAGRDTGAATALERLSTLAVYTDDKVNVEFTDEELVLLSSAIGTLELPSAAAVWEGLVETAMSGWFEGVPPLVERLLSQSTSSRAVGLLKKYLVAQGTGELLSEGSHEHTRTLAAALEQPFAKSIGEAARFYDHHHIFPLGTAWGIHVALISLISLGNEALDEIVSTLRDRKREASGVFDALSGPKRSRPSKEEAKRASQVLGNVDALLSAIVASLTTVAQSGGPGLSDSFAHSTEPFARSLWAVSLVRKTIGSEPSLAPELLLSKLQMLPEHEQRLCLGQIVFELRVRANQAQSRSEDPAPLPEWLCDAIVARAESPSTVEELVRLTSFYSGPLLSNWAPSTHEELMLALVAAGKTDRQSVFRVWNEILTVRRQDEHANRQDFPLVQVWGVAARELPVSERQEMLTVDASLLDKAERVLREPLIAHRDYKRWSRFLNEVLWVLLRSWAIGRASREDPDGERALTLARRAAALAEEEQLVLNAIGEMKGMAEHVIEELRSASAGRVSAKESP